MNHWLRRIFWLVAGLLTAQALVRLWVLVRPWPTPIIVAPLLQCGARRRYRHPEQTLAPLELRQGMRVLEIGPGTGLFTGELARQVGTDGMLLALDVQLPMLQKLGRCMSPDMLHGAVTLVAGDATHLPVADASVDAAVLIAVLPMIPNRVEVLRELRRVLHPGAPVIVSEDLLAPEYVPPVVTRHWLQRAGLTPVHQIDAFWCYSVVAKKPMN